MKQAVIGTFLFLAVSCRPSQPADVRPAPIDVLGGITAGQTRVVDLTHPLNAQNPYWPGPGYEPFKYEIFATLDKNGVLSGRFSMAEHTGTHLDAPNHFVAGQTSVDKIPIQQLFAPAIVIDVRQKVSGNPDYVLTVQDISDWERENGQIPQNAVVLLYTGWEERWNDYNQYKNAATNGTLHFPGFSPEAGKLLAEERDVAGIGIDTLSVDYGMSKDFAVHHVVHGRGKYHLENVANLGSVPSTGAFLIVAPIKIENGTGGPARIFALIRE
jgi:kynurenine formamidase